MPIAILRRYASSRINDRQSARSQLLFIARGYCPNLIGSGLAVHRNLVAVQSCPIPVKRLDKRLPYCEAPFDSLTVLRRALLGTSER